MTWLQLRLDTHPEHTEALEEALLAAGAVAVTMEDNADQPLLEPGVGEMPLWREIRLTGLFPADSNMQTVVDSLDAALLGGVQPHIEILEDKDWERAWMEHYRPMRFGERLWICPSWLEPPDPAAINLLLDPGLAFGTGTHPTTALCLAALEGAVREGDVLVDYGCGSGILAVAGARLGAGRLLCVDNDPQALTATADNAERNNVDPTSMTIALPGAYEESHWQAQADIVVANILAGPLLALAPMLCRMLKPGGTLLLAGLLDTQVDKLVEGYAPLLALRPRGDREGWVCLSGTSQPGSAIN